MRGPWSRWLGVVVRRERAALARIGLLSIAGVVLAFALTAAATTLTDLLRFDYGDASHLYGPVPAAASVAGAAAAADAGAGVGRYCDTTSRIEGVAAPVRLRGVEPGDTLAWSTFTSSPVSVGEGHPWVLVSERLGRLLDQRRDMAHRDMAHRDMAHRDIVIDGHAFKVAGTVTQPDDTNALLAVVALPVVEALPDANCGVLLDDPSPAVQAQVTEAGQGIRFVRSRADETGAAVLRPLVAGLNLFLLGLIGVFCRTGFSAISDRVGADLAAFVRAGMSPRLLVRRLFLVSAALGLGFALIGVALGLALAGRVADAVAGALGRIPPESAAVPGWVVAATVLVTVLACALAGGPAATRRVRELLGTTRGRPSRHRLSRGTQVCGAVGIVVTVWCLVFVVVAPTTAHNAALVALVVAALAPLLAAGLIQSAPAALVRGGGPAAVAARDAQRHRARYVPSLIAGALAVGLSLAVATVAATLVAEVRANPPVRPNEILVTARNGFGPFAFYSGFDPAEAVPDHVVAELRAAVGATQSVVLQRVLAEPRAGRTEPGELEVMLRTAQISGRDEQAVLMAESAALYVATPELQQALSLDLPVDTTDAVELFTGRANTGDDVSYLGIYGPPQTIITEIDELITTVSPSVLISERDAHTLGVIHEVGVLILAPDALTPTQRHAIDETANSLGVFVELPHDDRPLTRLQRWVTAIALIVGVGTVAAGTATVGSASRQADNSLWRIGLGRRGLRQLHRYRCLWVALSAIVLGAPIAFAPLGLAAVVPLGFNVTLPLATFLLVWATILAAPVALAGTKLTRARP